MAEQRKSIQTTFSFCKELSNSINERIKNNEKVEQNDLDALVEPFKEVVDFIKAYLILSNDVLYGTILMSINTEVNFKSRALVDLKIDGLSFTVSFNPLFIGNYTLSQVITLTVGEILRLIYEHPSEFSKKNEEKDEKKHAELEDASDASIYTLLSKEIKLARDKFDKARPLSIPNDFYSTADITAETDMRVKENESINYYYEVIRKLRKRNSKNSHSNSLSKNKDSSFDNNGNNIASPVNNQGKEAHDWEGSDPEKTSENGKSIIQAAYNNISSDKRGYIPNGILSQIEKMLSKPEITWKNILRKFIGTVPFPYRNTRKRLNRRQPERGDLPGRLPKRKVNIVICIDTSGSMSDSDIAYCMNEVFHIAKANETKITVIECDATVNRVYVAKKPEDIKPDVKGRGGTCFTPAIEYINKEGKFKDALMIYFTDGYGESEVPKPMTYRNMWVVLHDTKCLSVKNPYGEVKSLSMDGDYAKYKQAQRGF